MPKKVIMHYHQDTVQLYTVIMLKKERKKKEIDARTVLYTRWYWRERDIIDVSSLC